jgi:hypothetical protein
MRLSVNSGQVAEKQSPVSNMETGLLVCELKISLSKMSDILKKSDV